MYLTEQHIIKFNNPNYKEIDRLSFLSKNLYNQALYRVRQSFFNNNYKNYQAIRKELITEKQIDYYSLPTKVSVEVVRCIDNNFKSYFSLLKQKLKGEYKERVNLPKYLNKIKGRYVLPFPKDTISKKEYKKTGLIKLANTTIKVKTNIELNKIKQVRIVPRNRSYCIEVIYEVKEAASLPDNNRIASIDIGINNLATIGSNVIKPIIINGKPLKSINQYNKKKAVYQSYLKGNRNVSNKITSLTNKRNNKIKDYLHKASTYIVNHLVSNNIDTLIIGRNKNWKQEISIGKRNNQNFVSIPFF